MLDLSLVKTADGEWSLVLWTHCAPVLHVRISTLCVYASAGVLSWTDKRTSVPYTCTRGHINVEDQSMTVAAHDVRARPRENMEGRGSIPAAFAHREAEQKSIAVRPTSQKELTY